MNLRSIQSLIVLSILLIACGGDDDGSPGTAGGGTNGGFEQNITAEYTVDLSTTFSEELYPTDYPSNASFGTIVAIAHASELSIFQNGQLASDGVAGYAQTGDVDQLSSFLSSSGGEENEGQFFVQTEGSIDGEGSTSFDVTFTPTRTSLTVLVKLNPSPDWFIGISSLSIEDGDNLLEEQTIPLTLLDAGTRAGTTYSSSDEEESLPIDSCSDAPFVNGSPLAPAIGSITITRN